MAKVNASSNKAKIARRVVEVLEYFDDTHRQATVMDIVRRYDRPQSSTSELLSSLVELGLLYKDPYTRSYSLTARASLIGTSGQVEAVRDGRIVRLLDRLVAQTGLSVALFGIVGLKAQIVTWRMGTRPSGPALRSLWGGLQAPLTETAAGWLLLSTIAQPRCDSVIRRLNAEAADDRKFAFGEMAARVRSAQDAGHVVGPIGFGAAATTVAALLPGQAEGHPLAVGFVHPAEHAVQSEALIHCLREAIAQVIEDSAPAGQIQRLPTAA